MRLRQLVLIDFGPFRKYSITFADTDQVCLLLTGKNNEGKSSIITALKLLHAATAVVGKKKQEVLIEGTFYYRLLQQDTQDLLIGRMIHNYRAATAKIIGVFDTGFRLTVFLDSKANMVYAERSSREPRGLQSVFGFIPALGPLSEREQILGLPHIRSSLSTSLAPRHLRNHLSQLLDAQSFTLVREIIKASWEGIELLSYELDRRQNRIFCYYSEDRLTRELSWAGQGLQVWFQIVTHLVRLRHVSILVLDEPEINLHPEKQHTLLRIIREYFGGSVIVATHSVELMNSVSVSHIVNVQKRQEEPKVKSTADRTYLEVVRSQIGSSFNLIASQFDDVDIVIFTEDATDFEIIRSLAAAWGAKKRAFNIPLHGFSEYKKAKPYKEAYRLLIGKQIPCSILLDRDYYPADYLQRVREEMNSNGIACFFTPGKEIENIFLCPSVLDGLIQADLREAFLVTWNQLFESQRLESYGSYVTLHEKFLDPRLDTKTIMTKYGPAFERRWADAATRYQIVDGGAGLKCLRRFYRDHLHSNLSQAALLDALLSSRPQDVHSLVAQVYQEAPYQTQALGY